MCISWFTKHIGITTFIRKSQRNIQKGNFSQTNFPSKFDAVLKCIQATQKYILIFLRMKPNHNNIMQKRHQTQGLNSQELIDFGCIPFLTTYFLIRLKIIILQYYFGQSY